MTNIDIFIRGEGGTGSARHSIEENITIEALRLHLADGREALGFLIFEEDADEPLPDHHRIGHHGHGHKVLHHGRCRHVHVDVRYAGRPIERAFGPGSTLHRIKVWAEEQFGIDAADAVELSLQVAGTSERPDESTHVGSLAKSPDCRVVFDLLPTVRVNGSPS